MLYVNFCLQNPSTLSFFSFLRALGLLRLQFLPEKPERPKLFVRAPFFGFFGLSF